MSTSAADAAPAPNVLRAMQVAIRRTVNLLIVNLSFRHRATATTGVGVAPASGGEMLPDSADPRESVSERLEPEPVAFET
jgi:hypothetical protein